MILFDWISDFNKNSGSFILALLSFFFLSFTFGAEVGQSVVKNQNPNAKSANAKIFLASTNIPKMLSENFDKAVKWSTLDQQDSKNLSAAKKEQLLKQSELFKSNKEKIIAKISDKIEKELSDTFSEVELKYLADQSAKPFFIKLNNFLLSNQLKRFLSEPYAQANQLSADPKTNK